MLEPFIFKRIEDSLIFHIEEMTDSLQYCNRIRMFFGMLAQTYELIEKLIGVRHIEVARNDEVPGPPVVFTQKMMAIFHFVFAICAIPQMCKEQLSCECFFALKKRCVFQLRFFETFKAGHDAAKYILNGP